MSAQLTVVAHLVAKPGKAEEARAFLLSLVGPSRSEPGCVDYHLHQDEANPAEFTFYENWANRAEFEKHLEKPYLKAVSLKAPELFASDPHIRLMTMVSARP